MIRHSALLIMACMGAGCASDNSIYSWGHYEGILYSSYAEPGKLPPQQQILLLQEDLQKALAKNKPVPPGFHAYLGTLFAQLGQAADARREFQAEKSAFPESSVLMNRFLEKLPQG